jgi:DNA mismatch endonuclease (patch repair protein)
VDKLTPERRSDNMRKIRSRDTAPELIVRRLAHGMGYRYRLHAKDLPGKPDLIFPSRKKVIFIHGCFWHGHAECREGHVPKSRLDYWAPKLERNRLRDAAHEKALHELGWSTLTLWECQLSDPAALRHRLAEFLH